MKKEALLITKEEKQMDKMPISNQNYLMIKKLKTSFQSTIMKREEVLSRKEIIKGEVLSQTEPFHIKY